MVALLLGTAALPSFARKKKTKEVKTAVETPQLPANAASDLITSSWRRYANRMRATYRLPSNSWNMPAASIPKRLRCISMSRCITPR